ncbi:PfkB family carbohydrate kinase [Methylocapsa palsarum]|uniref:Sugar or nucleoside kinase, ribokinase family n=1 Tax=Methylocapsa palsarum TaxID=1612308 RepID=A0A1I4CK79_9HYPH|nr:PfkB family carbohydrate kinase [Methylocapsa palsarum]SFK81692.1 Sugar or nucleoside kinase, ribokinase family [Methylocapsa palsarum]
MADVLVVARPNLDRVWRLASPLAPGGRSSYERVEDRYGGGGFFTGAALIALGHRVRLVATLADDAQGRAFRDDLIKMGFDLENVKMVAGRTIPVEVLIDPSGERTIIVSALAEHAPVAALPPAAADVVYVNARRLEPRVMEAAMKRSLVVAQAPLEPDQRRPCHVLVASRSDLTAAQLADPSAFSRAVAGEAMEAFVLTDGALPVRIFSAAGEVGIPVAPVAPIEDSSGAGDVFCAGLIDALIRRQSIADSVRFGGDRAARFLIDRTNLFEASTA